MSLINQDSYSISINEFIYSLFEKAIQIQFSNVTEVAVVICNSKVADYQCNSPIAISQVNKIKQY